MHIVFWGSQEEINRLLPLLNKSVSVTSILNDNRLTNIPEAAAYVVLTPWKPNLIDFSITSKPILVNSVEYTLSELKTPPNVWRFNGWKPFVNATTWELSGSQNGEIDPVASVLQKQFIYIPDIVGFIAPRVIARIVNEAFITKDENISNEENIDLAMKLGVNYPYGPFEWATVIGHQPIKNLLQKLSLENPMYSPALELQAKN